MTFVLAEFCSMEEYAEGICLLSCIAIRKEPNSASEMTSQLLFGEVFLVVGQEEGWTRIMCDYDGYEGWISAAQLSYLKPDSFWAKFDYRVQTEFLLPTDSGGQTIQTMMGSNVRRNGHQPTMQPKPENLLATAKCYLNSPYQWGGRSLFGIDCSGFMQVVFKICGVKLLRDAYQQASQGSEVASLDDAMIGDLSFFENDKNRITHVGMMLGPGQIIHASGKVKIETIDSEGIYSREQMRHTHKLHSIRRII